MKTDIQRAGPMVHTMKVLWHLDIFRRSFRDLSGHACMMESCIFCALKELFQQFQHSDKSVLHPDALRRALAESFFDQQRFQLGCMDDAAECFENILQRLHVHLATQHVSEEACSVRHCIPHQRFAMTLVEQSVCGSCGATSEPLSFTQMVHYVSASALTSQIGEMAPPAEGVSNGEPPSVDFGKLLKKAGGMGDVRDCPSSCGARIQICRTLMNRPDVVSVGIVWDSERPQLDHIMHVLGTVGTWLKLSHVFHSVLDSRWAGATEHRLVGVVTYYGKHYSTFFYHTKHQVWIYFDDASVREIGPHWCHVVEKCRRGHFQPLLLLYSNPSGQPVPTDTAPQTRTFVSAAPPPPPPSVPGGGGAPPPTAYGSLPRPARRARTPNPERGDGGGGGGGLAAPRRAVTPSPGRQQAAAAAAASEAYRDYQNVNAFQSLYEQAEPEGSRSRLVNRYARLRSAEGVSEGAGGGRPPALPNFPDPGLAETRLAARGKSEQANELRRTDSGQRRRRDSGNWSGDRNSASSTSSGSNESAHPAISMFNRVVSGRPVPPPLSAAGRPPASPSRSTVSSSDQGGSLPDAGYDSNSLSSNDSYPVPPLLKIGQQQLSGIPENQTFGISSSDGATGEVRRLLAETELLLQDAQAADDRNDLPRALELCREAVRVSKRALDAPYNTAELLSSAKRSHNDCLLRCSGLQRRIAIVSGGKKTDAAREGRHSRQSSRDSAGRRTPHSRQSSRDLDGGRPPSAAAAAAPAPVAGSPVSLSVGRSEQGVSQDTAQIQLYATLPRRRQTARHQEPPPPPPPSAQGVEQLYAKVNKPRRDQTRPDPPTSPAPSTSTDARKEQKQPGKKQHKIRMKLLGGGLIRRKNRSLPDLTDPEQQTTYNADMSRPTTPSADPGGGYLSEGPVEYAAPNLQRSKLMRKSFHGSAALTRVPPPVPRRTDSRLTAVAPPSASPGGGGGGGGGAGGSHGGVGPGVRVSAGHPGGDVGEDVRGVNGVVSGMNGVSGVSAGVGGVMSGVGVGVDEPDRAPPPPVYLNHLQQSGSSSSLSQLRDSPIGRLTSHTPVEGLTSGHCRQPSLEMPLPPPPPAEQLMSELVLQDGAEGDDDDLPPPPTEAELELSFSQEPGDLPPPPPPTQQQQQQQQWQQQQQVHDPYQHLQHQQQRHQQQQHWNQQQHQQQQLHPGQTQSQQDYQPYFSSQQHGQQNGQHFYHQQQQQQQQQQANFQHQQRQELQHSRDYDYHDLPPQRSQTPSQHPGHPSLRVPESLRVAESSQQGQSLTSEDARRGSVRSVRDLAGRFEQSPSSSSAEPTASSPAAPAPAPAAGPYRPTFGCSKQSNQLLFSAQSGQHVRGSRGRRAAEEPSSVLRGGPEDGGGVGGGGVGGGERRRLKKSVTFCDQVTLVATAEDEQDDSQLPNPILQRILGGGQSAAPAPAPASSAGSRHHVAALVHSVQTNHSAENTAVVNQMQANIASANQMTQSSLSANQMAPNGLPANHLSAAGLSANQLPGGISPSNQMSCNSRLAAGPRSPTPGPPPFPGAGAATRPARPLPPYQPPPPPRAAGPCQLCSQRQRLPSAAYCADCLAYMTRLRPKAAPAGRPVS